MCVCVGGGGGVDVQESKLELMPKFARLHWWFAHVSLWIGFPQYISLITSLDDTALPKMGSTLKGKNLLPKEQILFCNNWPPLG